MKRNEVNVLIVDDVNAVRVQLKDLFEEAGFKKIHLASSGMEAKKILEGTTPVHLICSDWHMVPTNGMDLLRYVRTSKHHQNTPFIMITAANTEQEVMEAVQAGVDEYFVKPVNRDQIDQKVTRVLEKRKVLSS